MVCIIHKSNTYSIEYSRRAAYGSVIDEHVCLVLFVKTMLNMSERNDLVDFFFFLITDDLFVAFVSKRNGFTLIFSVLNRYRTHARIYICRYFESMNYFPLCVYHTEW